MMAIKKNISKDNNIDDIQLEKTVSQVETSSNKIQPKIKISNEELIKVTNATQGNLILIDSDGYRNVLENFGDTIEIEFGELIKLKKRYIKIFSENWIELNPVVLKALGVEKYYKNFINVSDFDNIFNLDVNELVEKVSNLSNSMKQSVGMRAFKLIEEGKLDSIKKINALEKILGYDLVEK